MASPPILNFETLLAPIDGPDPAGKPLPFDVRKKLDDSRKEISLSQFNEKDPRRPEQPLQADWPGIEELAQETLAQTSKDLLVAARLTEALVKHRRFAGLRDGLRLLRRLLQECWDRIYPVTNPDNQDGEVDAEAAAQEALAATIETRAAVFHWLDDEIRGARFPYTLRTVPLTRVGKDPEFSAEYGWQQWRDAQDAKGSVTTEAFEQAVAATPREYCQAAADDLAECAEELNGLSKIMDARMGEVAPGMTQVRRALIDCQDLAKYILHRKGPAAAAAPPSGSAAAPSEADGVAHSGAAVAAPRPLTRDDVLARLADASALLLTMEPHSPVAYLVQRAVKLARLPLPELMRVLVRDAGVLGQLDRDLDLGLEKQDAAKAGKNK
jgi:type VI secretion system protein ImpA